MSTLNALNTLEHSSTDQPNQSIEELLECIRLERMKYNKYAIIKEIILTCATEGCELPPNVQSKIFNILMAKDLEAFNASSNLLGLAPFDPPDLTFEESFQLKNVIQSGIIKKSNNIFHELEQLGITYNDNNKSQTFLGLSNDDKVFVDCKRELNELQHLYVLKLEELISVLDEIIKFQTQRLPDLSYTKINSYNLKLKSYELQSQMVNAKLRVSIFTETDCSLTAYRELMKDVLQQQKECKREIEELERLREEYKQVSYKKKSFKK
ncbi:hypothetical protein FQR65_LT18086 [Abscondita terminalis]|nr:hypothetical protein FQR65_LT18086 [Abscondita terminalis]